MTSGDIPDEDIMTTTTSNLESNDQETIFDDMEEEEQSELKKLYTEGDKLYSDEDLDLDYIPDEAEGKKVIEANFG